MTFFLFELPNVGIFTLVGLTVLVGMLIFYYKYSVDSTRRKIHIKLRELHCFFHNDQYKSLINRVNKNIEILKTVDSECYEETILGADRALMDIENALVMHGNIAQDINMNFGGSGEDVQTLKTLEQLVQSKNEIEKIDQALQDSVSSADSSAIKRNPYYV